MPRTSFAGSVTGPKVDVMIDLGNPFFNHTVDGFLKIGTVAATRVVAEDAFSAAKKGRISTHDFEHTLKKMCKEGAYWGKLSQISLSLMYVWMRLCSSSGKIASASLLLRWRTASTISSVTLTGTIAGVYVGAEYGIERVRGHRDWKNAMLGGALTGALVSVANNKNKDKVLVDAITGGAIATAAEFINYLT